MNLNKEELFSRWKNSSYGNDEITTSIAYNYDEYLSDPEIQLWFMDKEEEKSRQEDLAEGTIHKYSLAIRNPIKEFSKEESLTYGFMTWETSRNSEGYKMLWLSTNRFETIKEFLLNYYKHTLTLEDI
tara:strand:- start:56 stop:439 length:384 start_codon:yes stop_codon:yes gene_type:complete